MDLQTVVQNNPTIGFTLVLQLTGINGSRQFDKLTKTKTVESILLSMNADGITSYIEYLLGQMNDEDRCAFWGNYAFTLTPTQLERPSSSS